MYWLKLTVIVLASNDESVGFYELVKALVYEFDVLMAALLYVQQFKFVQVNCG